MSREISYQSSIAHLVCGLVIAISTLSCSKSPSEKSELTSGDAEDSSRAVTFVDLSYDPGIRSSIKSEAEKELDEEEEPEKKPLPLEMKGKETSIAADILSMPEGNAKFLAMSGLLSHWVSYDAEAALEFINEIEGICK